jgi:hypothetical protein
VREARGDIWGLVREREAVVVTINGDLTSAGRLVMGKGIALEAKMRVKGVDRVLGDSVARHGLHTILLSPASYTPRWDLFAFPTKYHWRDKRADPDLIVKSAHELVALVKKELWMYRFVDADHPPFYPNIWMPRPGCGAGGLRWEDVKPLLDPILDDRYVAVTK